MVSCSLQGGMSNQMSQIAATYALALRNCDETLFNFTSFTPLQGNNASKYRNTIYRNLKENNGYTFKHFYQEPKHSYQPIPYQKDLIIRGYFQSEKYIIDFKNEIRNLFYFDDVSINVVSKFLDTLNSKPICSVHVRRGDYLKFPDIHPVCSIEYYQKAMEQMGDCNFIFVSDSMDWVKENFKSDNIFYSPFNDEIMDMILMKTVGHNIIANSSFSWWGAWLNNHLDKKIIAPSIWFGQNSGIDTTDIIPESWIKI